MSEKKYTYQQMIDYGKWVARHIRGGRPIDESPSGVDIWKIEMHEDLKDMTPCPGITTFGCSDRSLVGVNHYRKSLGKRLCDRCYETILAAGEDK